MKIVSSRQMRSIDRRTIEEMHVPGLVLMENAGRQAADVVCDVLASAGGRSVAVVAGAGNNAGDGFVIARLLQEKAREFAVIESMDGGKAIRESRERVAGYEQQERGLLETVEALDRAAVLREESIGLLSEDERAFVSEAWRGIGEQFEEHIYLHVDGDGCG